MNYNLQGKAWEGASDLPEVNWRLGNPRIAKKGTPNGRAYMFAALFLLASSRMPTRTSPHRPISAPQSVQVTMLSLVEWAGTVSLLLPHWQVPAANPSVRLRFACLGRASLTINARSSLAECRSER